MRQVGTPEDLYVRPAHPDVAEFMGYRNQIRSRATKAGNLLSINIGGVGLQGTPIDGAEDGDIVALSIRHLQIVGTDRSDDVASSAPSIGVPWRPTPPMLMLSRFPALVARERIWLRKPMNSATSRCAGRT